MRNPSTSGGLGEDLLIRGENLFSVPRLQRVFSVTYPAGILAPLRIPPFGLAAVSPKDTLRKGQCPLGQPHDASCTAGGYSLARFRAGERDVPEAASCRPWNRTVEGPTSAVSGAREGEANEAEGMWRLPAFPESGISVECSFRKGFLPAPLGHPHDASPLFGRGFIIIRKEARARVCFRKKAGNRTRVFARFFSTAKRKNC